MSTSLAEKIQDANQEKESRRPTFPAYIDSSTLSTWRACRRKYFWSTISSLYPLGKSVHLIAGGAFAAGMEAARRLAFRGNRNNPPSHHDLLQAAFKAFIKEWGDYIPPDESPKSFAAVFQALSFYLSEYPPQTDPIQPYISADGSPGVEFTFSIPLDIRHPETDDPILFVGRFDMLGSYNGLPCIVDEKTTGKMGSGSWALRGQFMGYCWACQQMGLPVNVAVVREIGLYVREYKIQQHMEQYPQHLIERWAFQLNRDVRMMVRGFNSLQASATSQLNFNVDDHYPYNFADSCTAFGGCAFMPLCLAKDPEPYFNSYSTYRWNPLAKQPIKELENQT